MTDAIDIVVLAGLGVDFFDKVRRVSSTRLVPTGHLIARPLGQAKMSYSDRYIDILLTNTYDVIRQCKEMQKISIQLIYVERDAVSTERLKRRFFPFSLPVKISQPSLSSLDSKRIRNERLNLFVEALLKLAADAKRRARIVKGCTDVPNLTPLLLPVANFRAGALSCLLETLSDELAVCDDPKSLIDRELKRFFSASPRVTPGTDARHCFSDGYLFFKSPGRDRHGFFRADSSVDHKPECLLAARSRIGGAYDYTFHYDCTPTKGALPAQYPNCHGRLTSPKKTHVNIAPNDYVI